MLHRSPPASNGHLLLPGRIAQRTFFGVSWDYVVALEPSGRRLRVAAPASAVYADGEAAWLEIDPAHIVPIE